MADPARMSISPTKKYCANIELPDKEKDLGVDPDADADHFDMGWSYRKMQDYFSI